MTSRALARAMALPAVLFLCAAASAGCAKPCKKLANQVCAELGNDEATCERWRESISKLPDESCEEAMKRLDEFMRQ